MFAEPGDAFQDVLFVFRSVFLSGDVDGVRPVCIDGASYPLDATVDRAVGCDQQRRHGPERLSTEKRESAAGLENQMAFWVYIFGISSRRR